MEQGPEDGAELAKGVAASLEGSLRAFVESRRSATLATIAPAGRARLVPICFVLHDDGCLYTPLDDKPKRGSDRLALARARDIAVRPQVTLLFERWSEDWSELAWVRLDGRATLLEPTADPTLHGSVAGSLRAKYPPYAGHRLEQLPLIRVVVAGVASWSATGQV